jgi:hypothetical protein
MRRRRRRPALPSTEELLELIDGFRRSGDAHALLEVAGDMVAYRIFRSPQVSPEEAAGWIRDVLEHGRAGR